MELFLLQVWEAAYQLFKVGIVEIQLCIRTNFKVIDTVIE